MAEERAATDQAWPDRSLTENQQRVRQAAELIPVGRAGARPENFAQLVDYAGWMAKARTVVPEHLLNNVGACLAVIEIADKFNYPAYMVARQSYVVNNVLTFMGQFIMAAINDFCPLRRRLQYRFEGDGADLQIIVTGHFKGEVDPVEYTSPKVSEIKVKNSPLWASDPRQQLVYFGSRRWQSRYWPEGLFGIYSPDEIDEAEPLRHDGAEAAKDVTPGLTERIAGQKAEGYRDGHAAAELDKVAAGATETVIEATAEKPTEKPQDAPKPAAATPAATGTKNQAGIPATKAGKPKKGKAPADEPEDPVRATAAECQTSEEYLVYAKHKIDDFDGSMQQAQGWFDDDMKDRERLRVSVAVRANLQRYLDEHFANIAKKKK